MSLIIGLAGQVFYGEVTCVGSSHGNINHLQRTKKLDKILSNFTTIQFT